MTLDRSKLEESTGGDPELLVEIAELFIDDAKSLVDQIEAALGIGDEAEVRRFGHTLKSSSAAVGALELSALCFEVEKGGLEVASARLSEIHAKLDAATLDLRSIVGEFASA